MTFNTLMLCRAVNRKVDENHQAHIKKLVSSKEGNTQNFVWSYHKQEQMMLLGCYTLLHSHYRARAVKCHKRKQWFHLQASHSILPTHFIRTRSWGHRKSHLPNKVRGSIQNDE